MRGSIRRGRGKRVEEEDMKVIEREYKGREGEESGGRRQEAAA